MQGYVNGPATMKIANKMQAKREAEIEAESIMAGYKAMALNIQEESAKKEQPIMVAGMGRGGRPPC